MTTHNLAIVFAPNLARSGQMSRDVAHMGTATTIVQILIERGDVIFAAKDMERDMVRANATGATKARPTSQHLAQDWATPSTSPRTSVAGKAPAQQADRLSRSGQPNNAEPSPLRPGPGQCRPTVGHQRRGPQNNNNDSLSHQISGHRKGTTQECVQTDPSPAQSRSIYFHSTPHHHLPRHLSMTGISASSASSTPTVYSRRKSGRCCCCAFA